jgi:multiple sugar transport system permease protein
MKKKITLSNQEKLVGWKMATPALVFFLVTGIYPYIMNIYYSLTNWNLIHSGPVFTGAANYIKAFADSTFLLSVLRTFGFIAIVIPLEFCLGLGMALLLSREDIKGKNIFRSLILLPMMLSPVVTSVIWKMMYSVQFGPLNYFFKVLGLSDGRTEWLSDPKLAFPALAVATIWMWFPFSFLVLLAGLQSIPREQYESAKIDGASWWNELRYITLPNLLPSIMVVVLVRFLDALKTFALVYTLTGGGPGSSTELIYYEIFRVAFRDFNIGYASSLSIIVVLVSILACGLILKLSRKYASYEY